MSFDNRTFVEKRNHAKKKAVEIYMSKFEKIEIMKDFFKREKLRDQLVKSREVFIDAFIEGYLERCRELSKRFN